MKKFGEVLEANFDTDMAAIVAENSETGLVTTATIETFRTGESLRKQLTAAESAVIGVYGVQTLTEVAKPGGSNNERQSTNTVIAEYVTVGGDHAKVTKQCMLAAEAIIRSIDRIPGTDRVVEAAALRNSVQVELSQTSLVNGKRVHWNFARVQFPVEIIDTIA